MEFISSIIDFFVEMIKVLLNVIVALQQTTDTLDGVDFKDSDITLYIGYVKYITGPYLFTALWTCCAIPVAMFIFNFAMRSYVWIKQLIS